MMEAAPGEGRGSSVVAPAPTSAFAPPPQTLGALDGGMPRVSIALPGYADASIATPAAETPSTRPPSSDCGDGCTTAWNACKEKCAGAKCDACAATYKHCMRGCFK
jgi:hypothetical protein